MDFLMEPKSSGRVSILLISQNKFEKQCMVIWCLLLFSLIISFPLLFQPAPQPKAKKSEKKKKRKRIKKGMISIFSTWWQASF